MADEAEQVDVAIVDRAGASAGQLAPRGNQGRAGAVFEAALPFVHRVEHENVALERQVARARLRAVPERDLGLADAARVGKQPFAVEPGPGAGDDEIVRRAARNEGAAPEVAELERMIDELVVVVCDEAAARGSRPHRGRDLPVARQRTEDDRMRLAFAAVHPQAQARAVEEAALRVQKGRAH